MEHRKRAGSVCGRACHAPGLRLCAHRLAPAATQGPAARRLHAPVFSNWVHSKYASPLTMLTAYSFVPRQWFDGAIPRMASWSRRRLPVRIAHAMLVAGLSRKSSGPKRQQGEGLPFAVWCTAATTGSVWPTSAAIAQGSGRWGRGHRLRTGLPPDHVQRVLSSRDVVIHGHPGADIRPLRVCLRHPHATACANSRVQPPQAAP